MPWYANFDPAYAASHGRARARFWREQGWENCKRATAAHAASVRLDPQIVSALDLIESREPDFFFTHSLEERRAEVARVLAEEQDLL